jgi:hypothetical protein
LLVNARGDAYASWAKVVDARCTQTKCGYKFQCGRMNGRKNMKKGAPKFHGSNHCSLLGKSSEEELWWSETEVQPSRSPGCNAIALVPLHKRKTLQKLASSIGIPLRTVHRMYNKIHWIML